LNTKESTKTWIFILLFMVATAVLAALWPTLTGSGSNTVAVPNETMYVQIPIVDKEIAAPIAMAAIAAGATVLIVAVGVGITMLFTLFAKFIHKEEESDSYTENMAALAAQEKETLAAKNKTIKTTGASDSRLNKWPTWGTAILMLFLVGSLSVMASHLLWPPTGDVLVDGKIVPMGMNFVMFMLSSTAVILAVFLRPAYINNVDKTDGDSAPWALYWVVMLGLLVVGLNFGFMLYLGSL
jgi:hypothetical protein